MAVTQSKSSNSNPAGVATLLQLWPLIFVPITLYCVKTFGHSAGSLLLGALFFYLFVFKSDVRVRKFMIALAVMSMIFETANVAAGLYQYHGILGAPTWIALGWAILGWWIVQLTPTLARLEFKTTFAALAGALVAIPYLNGSLGVSSLIAIAGFYAIYLSTQQPFGVFAFGAGFAMLAEFSGTATGVWSYFDLAGTGVIVPPNLASLAMAYSVVLAFCYWISGYETQTKNFSPDRN